MVERSLGRLAALVSRRRRAVVAVWLVLLAAGGWFSLHQNEHLSGGGWEVPGSPSLRTADALDRFPGVTPPAFTLLVTGTPKSVRARLAAVAPLVRRDPSLRLGRARV